MVTPLMPTSRLPHNGEASFPEGHVPQSAPSVSVIAGQTGVQSSASIAQLAKALALAQGEFSMAAKDKTNPHFNSRYADLASIVEASRKPLAAHGLAITQMPSVDLPAKIAGVITVLMHESGEYLASSLLLPVADLRPHSVGSAISYARRYSLASVLGLAADDDDGNEAAGVGSRTEPARPRSNTSSRPAYKGVAGAPAQAPAQAPSTSASPAAASTTSTAPESASHDDTEPTEPAKPRKPGDWRSVVMIGGSAKGQPLGSLSDEFLNDLYAKWRPEHPSAKAREVLEALAQRQRELEAEAAAD